jgi:hypothetical protein
MTTQSSKTSLPRLSTTITFVVIFLLIYLFFSKLSLKFYASILFFLYHYIQHMWLAVIGLGVVQTILLMPFRAINLILQSNVKEFEVQVEELKDQDQQQFLIKQTIRKGNPTILWYIVNFVTQVVAYISVGRLFLIDFYNFKLNPDLLFSFSYYPQYPIKDPIFKLPYPYAQQTTDYGLIWVFIAWGSILLIKLFYNRFTKYYHHLSNTQKIQNDSAITRNLKSFIKNSAGFLTLFFILAYILIRKFPTHWELRIFSGDVSIPNYTLNFITAVGAFIVVLWLNLPKISKKAEVALHQGIPEDIVFKTQKRLFIDNLRSAVLLGLGAYYITRLIPSAFELSIFTLEIISLTSPLTIDRLIFARFKPRLT